MPLTPPEYCDGFLDDAAVGLAASAATNVPQRTSAAPYNTDRHTGHTFAAPYSQKLQASTSHRAYGNEQDHRLSRKPNPWLENSSGSYNSASMPILPPIQIPEQSTSSYPSANERRNQPVPQTKEDKVVGGVAVHLDYEMEQMAEFVSEMAQGMYDLYQSRICLADIDLIRSVNPKSTVPLAFRKYVSQILSSTRLPSTTILLALHYLATRMNMLSSNSRQATGNGQVYRMLTTSLLLGSKFLDDNTFQNRSWSEVSNIPVGELNVLEIEWLVAIHWEMHINPEDPQGFLLWRQHWDQWRAKKIELSMDSLKLSPLDVNVQRRPSTQFPTRSRYLSSYHTAQLETGCGVNQLSSQWQAARRRDQWPLSFRSKTEYSPPSAPETGPSTPQWFDGSENQEYPQPQPLLSRPTLLSSGAPIPALNQISYQTSYAQPYNLNNWNGHGISCACGYCVPYCDRYLMAPGFGPQPVIS
ncbi:MAG: hypothetical protein Q9190_001584 [Brigantiaea leucoxantha]